MRLRLIQAGMGGWVQNWALNVLRPSDDVDVVGFVDADAATLAEARARLGLAPERCYTSFERALAEAKADAVLVTASLPGHIPLTRAALAAGKHVLLEKPFAPTLAEAREAVAAAEAAGRILMISQNYRFFPAPRAVAALVQAATLGPVGAVSVDFRRYANSAPVEGNRHYTIPHPLLIDMAIHHFDLMRLVLGREPREVVCQTWNPPWSNFANPAAAAMTVTFDGDVVVNYRGSWVSPSPATAWAGEWRMECARGELSWTSRSGGVDPLSAERVAVRPLGKRAQRVQLPALAHIGRAGILAAFVRAVRTGEEPETSGRDNLRTLALMAAAIQSAASGAPVAAG